MTTVADTGFLDMHLGKIVGVAAAEGEGSGFVVVLDGLSEDRHLPMEIGETEAFNLSARPAGSGHDRSVTSSGRQG